MRDWSSGFVHLQQWLRRGASCGGMAGLCWRVSGRRRIVAASLIGPAIVMPAVYPLAPRWRRVVSLCYECLLLLAVMLASGALFQLLLGMAGVAATAIAGSPLWRNLLGIYWLLVVYGYFAWCWHKGGQTLPMRTWRLQLLSRNGGRLSQRAMLVRFLVSLIAYAPLVPVLVWVKHTPGNQWATWLACAWAALPVLWSLLDRDRQFLHDRLAGTQIVLLPTQRE